MPSAMSPRPSSSIPLITASILSKKLAAGLGGLVLDVKAGNGAFMPTYEQSKALAESLVAVANGAGTRTSALITDMSEPLASAAGNAVEVMLAVDFLTGRHRDPRLHEVTVALGAEMLVLGGLAETPAAASRKIEEALESGAAAEIFGRMVKELGGPADFVEHPEVHLDSPSLILPALPEERGVVGAVDTRAIGIAVIELGGGRARASDPIDHAVGFTRLAPVGAEVGPDRPLAMVHARSDSDAERAAATLRKAYRLGYGGMSAKAIYERIEQI